MMVNAETYIPILIPVNGSIFVGELITLFFILVFVLSVIWYGVKGFRQGGAEVRRRRAAMGRPALPDLPSVPSLAEAWRRARAQGQARRAMPPSERPSFFEVLRRQRTRRRAIWAQRRAIAAKRRAMLRAWRARFAAAQPKGTETPPAANDPLDSSWRI
jgi:hypothetical protein